MKRYKDLIKIGYPMSNLSYVIALNDRVLEDKGEAPTHISEHSLLEPETIEIMSIAGIFNKKNKEIS